MPGNGRDVDTAAHYIVLDGHGNAVAAGTLLGTGIDLDFAVVSFDAATGRFDGGCTKTGSCGRRGPIFAIPRTPAGRLPRS